MPVFPPQQYYRFDDKNTNCNPYTGFVGCWKITTAKKVALILKKDGFKVKLRGRGPREKYHARYWIEKPFRDLRPPNWSHWKRSHWDFLPLKYADYASVYVKEVYLIEEVDYEYLGVGGLTYIRRKTTRFNPDNGTWDYFADETYPEPTYPEPTQPAHHCNLRIYGLIERL